MNTLLKSMVQNTKIVGVDLHVNELLEAKCDAMSWILTVPSLYKRLALLCF